MRQSFSILLLFGFVTFVNAAWMTGGYINPCVGCQCVGCRGRCRSTHKGFCPLGPCGCGLSDDSSSSSFSTGCSGCNSDSCGGRLSVLFQPILTQQQAQSLQSNFVVRCPQNFIPAPSAPAATAYYYYSTDYANPGIQTTFVQIGR